VACRYFAKFILWLGRKCVELQHYTGFDSLFPLFFNTNLFFRTSLFFNTNLFSHDIFFPITYAYYGRIGLTPNLSFSQSLFLFNHIFMYHGRIGSTIGLSRLLKFGLRLLVCFSWWIFLNVTVFWAGLWRNWKNVTVYGLSTHNSESMAFSENVRKNSSQIK